MLFYTIKINKFFQAKRFLFLQTGPELNFTQSEQEPLLSNEIPQNPDQALQSTETQLASLFNKQREVARLAQSNNEEPPLSLADYMRAQIQKMEAGNVA